MCQLLYLATDRSFSFSGTTSGENVSLVCQRDRNQVQSSFNSPWLELHSGTPRLQFKISIASSLVSKRRPLSVAEIYNTKIVERRSWTRDSCGAVKSCRSDFHTHSTLVGYFGGCMQFVTALDLGCKRKVSV